MKSENLPKITIITPSFMQAKFIERTFASILDQNYPALEYIVIDGGSTDGTVEIIQRYSRHFAHWESQKDRGQSDAINKGLNRATGEIVGWLNSDDTFAPGSLQRIGRYYADHPLADFLYGHTNLIDENDQVIRRLFAIPTNFQELGRFNRNLFSQPGTTWRKRLQDRIGVLNEKLHFTMDCDFYMRAARETKLHFTPHHLANLRIHGETKTNNKRDLFMDEHKQLGKTYGFVENNSPARTRLFRLQRLGRIARQPQNWMRILGR